MTGLYTAIAAAALSAIGSGVGAYSQQQNLKNQDKQAAANIIAQGKINSEATGKVNDLNQQIAKSNANDQTKNQTADYIQALQRANPTQAGATAPVKGGSKRFAEANAQSTADVNKYARDTAGAMAATAAPQLQRIGEGNAIASTASDLGLLNDKSNMQQGIFKTQLGGDQSNPWLNSLSGLLQGSGSGLSTYAGMQAGKKGGNPYLGGG